MYVKSNLFLKSKIKGLSKVERFCFAHCDDFIHVKPRSSSADPTVEYPLHCKEIHTMFVNLIEDELEAALFGERCSISNFVALVEKHKSLGDKFSRVLEALLNLDVFVQMMEDARSGLLLDLTVSK